MTIDKKCDCGSKSTGNTTIRCCNLCGLPIPTEPWHFNLPEDIFNQAGVMPKVTDDGHKIRWFMELALKMREMDYSDASIYSIDTDAWDEYRVNDELTPKQAITEENTN